MVHLYKIDQATFNILVQMREINTLGSNSKNKGVSQEYGSYASNEGWFVLSPPPGTASAASTTTAAAESASTSVTAIPSGSSVKSGTLGHLLKFRIDNLLRLGQNINEIFSFGRVGRCKESVCRACAVTSAGSANAMDVVF